MTLWVSRAIDCRYAMEIIKQTEVLQMEDEYLKRSKVVNLIEQYSTGSPTKAAKSGKFRQICM